MTDLKYLYMKFQNYLSGFVNLYIFQRSIQLFLSSQIRVEGKKVTLITPSA